MMKENKQISWFLGIFTVILVISCIFSPGGWLLAATMLILSLFLFTLYFSRDPERHVPHEPGMVLAPADGRIIKIKNQQEPKFCHGNVQVVSIFLRPWDVHVNRAPVEGLIAYSEYRRGRFHPAFFKKSAKENEQQWTGIENGEGRFLLKQVAGILARRIVCNVQIGNYVGQGQKFGFIRMGSLVELYMPQQYQIAVRKGQLVRAGETILGRLSSEK
jgi:phosphatidylserine decarboxylase